MKKKTGKRKFSLIIRITADQNSRTHILIFMEGGGVNYPESLNYFFFAPEESRFKPLSPKTIKKISTGLQVSKGWIFLKNPLKKKSKANQKKIVRKETPRKESRRRIRRVPSGILQKEKGGEFGGREREGGGLGVWGSRGCRNECGRYGRPTIQTRSRGERS